LLSNVKKYIPIKILVLLLSIYLLCSTVSLFQGQTKLDEHKNHLPVLQGMNEQGYFNYIFSDDYKTANTPLPYLFPLLIAKITSANSFLIISRSLNIIVSFITLLLFLLLLKRLESRYKYSVLLLLFYPYFIKTSFVFYLSIYGLFFLLSAICLSTKETKLRSFSSGLSGAAALLSQQFIIALPFAFAVWKFLKRKDPFERKGITNYILFFLPFIIPAILFITWGGLTHPNWRFHSPTIDFTHFTALFTILGGVFFPFIIDKIKAINKSESIALMILSLLLTIFFVPNWGEYGWEGQVTGYTYNFLTRVNDISSILFFVIHFVLCFSGLQIFTIIIRSGKNRMEMLIIITALILSFIYFFDTVFSERHLLPLVALLFILVIPRIQNKLLLNLWIIYQVVFGSVYFYYWLFIHPSFI